MSDAKKRRTTTNVACPIVYGSISCHLPKKVEGFATHRWTLYVRGPNNEDLSTFIQKICFTLHPSFAEPIREITNSPFEVSENGWGEFEAGIRIYFVDADEQPIDLFHTIQLYPIGVSNPLNQKKPVVAEHYDEIVFADPKESFFQQLMMYTPRDAPLDGLSSSATNTSLNVPTAVPHLVTSVIQESGLGTVFDDSLDVERLSAIHNYLVQEIDAAKSRLLHLETSIIETNQQRRTAQHAIRNMKILPNIVSDDSRSNGNSNNNLTLGMNSSGSGSGGDTTTTASTSSYMIDTKNIINNHSTTIPMSTNTIFAATSAPVTSINNKTSKARGGTENKRRNTNSSSLMKKTQQQSQIQQQQQQQQAALVTVAAAVNSSIPLNSELPQTSTVIESS